MSVNQFIPNLVLSRFQNEDETMRWIASHEHFELEKLRVSDPERYHMIYPSVLRIWQQRRNDFTYE